ncbi:MAG TPA: ribosomal protein S18-alanine N-acetyltransferase [Smithella sp.]|nr:ribosomal protein S18-alanine N-acetyltransferase [Smithella sp.]
MSSEKVFPKVIIDLMDRDDLPQILIIEGESFASPWSPGMFTRELASGHARCLCARINSENKSVVGGYIIFWMVAGEMHLQNLAVKKEYRRHGLALGLMRAMGEIARENKVTSQTLEVRESNTEAIKLYQKCGFVVKGIRPLYYSDTYEDALIMWAEDTNN